MSREEQRRDAAARKAAEVISIEKRRKAELALAALELDRIDLKILELLTQHPAISQEAIGDLVGLERRAVGARMNAEKFKRALQRAAMTALEIFEANKAKAATVLANLLDSPDETVRLRSALAHMWPHIHADPRTGGAEDLVGFITEAFERAEAEKKKGTGS